MIGLKGDLTRENKDFGSLVWIDALAAAKKAKKIKRVEIFPIGNIF